MFALAVFGFAGPLVAGLLLAGFLSDVFDGVVARRQGVATPMLRYADTLIDTFFYLAAAVAMRVSVPQVFAGVRLVVVALIIIHVSRTTFELTKYGRIASYHMWSSRALGILMVTAMTVVFVTGRPSALVTATLWFAIANELEGFAASAI